MFSSQWNSAERGLSCSLKDSRRWQHVWFVFLSGCRIEWCLPQTLSYRQLSTDWRHIVKTATTNISHFYRYTDCNLFSYHSSQPHFETIFRPTCKHHAKNVCVAHFLVIMFVLVTLVSHGSQPPPPFPHTITALRPAPLLLLRYRQSAEILQRSALQRVYRESLGGNCSPICLFSYVAVLVKNRRAAASLCYGC